MAVRLLSAAVRLGGWCGLLLAFSVWLMLMMAPQSDIIRIQDPTVHCDDHHPEKKIISRGGPPPTDDPEDNGYRVQQMKETCKYLPDRVHHRPNASIFDWLLADDRRKSIYCPVSKAGSTSWKYMLIKDRNPNFADPKTDRAIHVHNEKVLAKHGLRYLKTYSEEEALHKIRTYFKYIIVRNPLDRILSSYRDKIMQPDEPKYHEELAATIKSQYPEKNASEPVTFQEFIDYILKEDPLRMDRHWMSMHLLCQSCFVQYDYIAKVETISKDGPRLQKRLIGNQTKQLPFFNSHGEGNFDDMTFMKAYRDNITRDQYHKLVLMYHTDMQMFGYETPAFETNDDAD